MALSIDQRFNPGKSDRLRNEDSITQSFATVECHLRLKFIDNSLTFLKTSISDLNLYRIFNLVTNLLKVYGYRDLINNNKISRYL